MWGYREAGLPSTAPNLLGRRRQSSNIVINYQRPRNNQGRSPPPTVPHTRSRVHKTKDNNLLSCCFEKQRKQGKFSGKKLRIKHEVKKHTKGVKRKSNPYLCGVDNTRIFTVNVWDEELRLTWRPISSQDHQSNNCLNLACVGPCVTPHFPRVLVSVGRKMTRGKHSHLHTRGDVSLLISHQQRSVWKSDSPW